MNKMEQGGNFQKPTALYDIVAIDLQPGSSDIARTELNKYRHFLVILLIRLIKYMVIHFFYPSALRLEGYCRLGLGGRATARLAEPISP